MKQNLTLNISDGQAFFAHEASINFSPTQVHLDFKSVTPRMDQRSKEQPVLSVQHNLVMVDPYHATLIHKLLGRALKDYEKQFGKIEKPKAVAKAQEQKPKQDTTEVPHYFG